MKRLARSLLVASTPAWLASCATQPQFPETPPPDKCAAGAFPDAELAARIEHGGRTRQLLVWVPPTPGPHDVIVNLHEFRSNPRTQAQYTGWITHARAINAILVAPDGKSSTWNAGDCCGKARDAAVDDVAFLDAVAKRVDDVGCTTGRVLATGIGNGGMMAERWACESTVPDAVVSVGGSLQVDTCARSTPIPVLHYHGDADAWMPADGSGHHMPVSHAASEWQRINGAVRTDRIEDGTLVCEGWDGGASTRFCTIKGGKDRWPGAPDNKLSSGHALADATVGAWAWVVAQWDRGATEATVQIPPFSPEKLASGLPTGTRMRYLYEAEGEPARTEQWEVTASGPKGCTIATTTFIEDQPVGEPESREYTWDELAAHARFDPLHTRRTTGEVQVPAGKFSALQYRVQEQDPAHPGEPTETSYSFATDLPGPPALMVVTRGGQERSRMTLLERQGPPPAAPVPPPPPAP